MSLESATYINQLNVLNPDGAVDLVSTSDDHLRLIKSTLKNTFPNITGAVGATQDDLSSISFLVAGGTANAITVTPSPVWSSYINGKGFTFKASNNSTATSVTIQVNALAAIPLVTADGNPPVIYSNSIYDVTYNGSAFVVKNDTIKKVITDSITITPATLTKASIISTAALGLSTSSIERLTIDSSGNVGINNSTPAYPLDVVGTTARFQSGTSDVTLLVGPQTNNGSFYGSSTAMGFQSSTTGAYITMSKDAASQALNINAGNTGAQFSLNSNGSLRLYMGTSGNVCIGTNFTSGTSKLNIQSSDTFLMTLTSTASGVVNGSKFITIDTTGTFTIRNNANTTSIMTLTDAGVVSFAGGISAASIAVGFLANGMAATTQSLNNRTTALATTAFANPNNGSRYYVLPSGQAVFWGLTTVAANSNTTVAPPAGIATSTGWSAGNGFPVVSIVHDGTTTAYNSLRVTTSPTGVVIYNFNSVSLNVYYHCVLDPF